MFYYTLLQAFLIVITLFKHTCKKDVLLGCVKINRIIFASIYIYIYYFSYSSFIVTVMELFF